MCAEEGSAEGKLECLVLERHNPRQRVLLLSIHLTAQSLVVLGPVPKHGKLCCPSHPLLLINELSWCRVVSRSHVRLQGQYVQGVCPEAVLIGFFFPPKVCVMWGGCAQPTCLRNGSSNETSEDPWPLSSCPLELSLTLCQVPFCGQAIPRSALTQIDTRKLRNKLHLFPMCHAEVHQQPSVDDGDYLEQPQVLSPLLRSESCPTHHLRFNEVLQTGIQLFSSLKQNQD